MNEQEPQKPKGWFSRRHETREAHDKAVEKYKAGSARHRAKLARLTSNKK